MSGSAPAVAFYCATFLKPEMHHVYRQITALRSFRPVVVTQKIENRGTFPLDPVVVVPKSPLRFASRAIERHLTRRPWQISSREAAMIRKALAKNHAALMHLFFGNVAVHMLPLLRSLALPCVVSFHGADVTGAIATEPYRRAREAMFKASTFVACRSEALMRDVERLGCPAARLRLLRTALPEIVFRHHRLPSGGAIRIVQASRLIPKKGLATSLRAFAEFARSHPNAWLHLAGEGPQRAELAALAAQLGIAGRVVFEGFLSQRELHALYESAHIFVHPSETSGGDVEGVPNAMLEAMASGLPVVATRHGGIPEAVTDGRSGYLVGERNPSSVAEALLRIASDNELYDRMSESAAKEARTKFSREAQAAAIEALYAEAIQIQNRKS